MRFNTQDYREIADAINSIISTLSYEVNPNVPAGENGKINKSVRQFRLVPKKSVTSDSLERKSKEVASKLPSLAESLKYKNFQATDIRFNTLSPNSSQFPSVSLTLDGNQIDLVITGKRRGMGGLSFEGELVSDLNTYFSGVGIDVLKHSDAVEKMVEELGLSQEDNYSAALVPGFRKREMSFNGSTITINNNTGAVIADFVIKYKSSIKYYVSLKLGKTYFALNGSVGKYFVQPTTKKEINEFFGFNGTKMGAFGQEYVVETEFKGFPAIRNNLASVLDQAYGRNLVIVHKRADNDVYVANIGSNVSVTVSELGEDSYIYPVLGRRRYANIRCKAVINGQRYRVEFQFRGTEGGSNEPRYLRLLLERL